MRFSQSRHRWSHDDMDTTVARLECPNDELGQPRQFQAARIKPTSAAARYLREQPAQIDPNVQQNETDRDEHKAVRGILRRRPATDRARAAVTRFDPEAPAVLAARLTRRPVQMDQNKDHPLAAPLQAFRALGGSEHTTHRELGRKGGLVGAMERVSRSITFVPLAQCARAAGLAPDRAGDNG